MPSAFAAWPGTTVTASKVCSFSHLQWSPDGVDLLSRGPFHLSVGLIVNGQCVVTVKRSEWPLGLVVRMHVATLEYLGLSPRSVS